MDNKQEMACRFIEGGTGEVCEWINRNGLAGHVVSIVKNADYQYLVFYRVETQY